MKSEAYLAPLMASKKAVFTEEEQLERALVGARAVLRDKGVVSGAKLGGAKIRARVLAQLAREGFEKAGTKVRLPLESQLAALLEEGAHLPLGTLAKRLKGTTGPETKSVVGQFARDGRAHIVLRGKQLSVVPARERIVPRSELTELLAAALALVTWIKKAKADKLPVTVLQSDLSEALSELGFSQVASTTSPEADASPHSWNSLRGVLLALQDEDSGLISVPTASARIRDQLSGPQVIELLLQAHQKGKLELRPEGGIGRLSEAEAALCPMGPGGIPLSWARLTENKQ